MSTSIAQFTTLRLGGPVGRIVTAETTAELIAALREVDAEGAPLLLIGGGSNLVVGDEGWPGTALLIRTRGVEVELGDERVRVKVAAGESWDDLVARSVAEKWSGLAAMSGIPGLVGATPVQNVGAYGSEVADVLESVTVYDRRSGSVESWPAVQCEFAFRSSVFKHTDRYVVLDVTFLLPFSAEAPPIRYAELAARLGVPLGGVAAADQVRQAVLTLRKNKGMLLDEDDHDAWSVGSFFVNPIVEQAQAPAQCPQWPVGDKVKLSAAWLIEQAGFGRGFGLDRGRGRVAVSTKHTLALTNRGEATTRELLDLALEIREGVQAKFGIRLGPEARLAGCALD